MTEWDACLSDAGLTERACGTASTYNNAGCRGEDCRAAVNAYRREQRSKAASQTPKRKQPREGESDG